MALTPARAAPDEDPPDDELARLRLELVRRDELLAMVAHELRNPLHSLGLQLGAARASGEAGHHGEALRRIEKAEQALARYTARATVLLDLLRSGARHYPVVPREADLAELLTAVADSIRSQADYHGVHLRLDLPMSCIARTDALALEHAVGNLLLNAVKHSGGTQVVLSLTLPSPGMAEIVVADDGRGLTAPEAQRLLRTASVPGLAPTAVDARSHPGKGSGLGLWIVRELVRALGGTITVATDVPRGSRLALRVPLNLQSESTADDIHRLDRPHP
ncbi:MAG TPA: HAMP domain-containing sensor histidine kinase [Burkholderiaceae bacterium]|nr:HAMP domain-containing sensor histidine kinase [Burkholderiaceae bacterium]